MKINEIEVIKEDYPGLALSMNSNIGRMLQTVSTAIQSEEPGKEFAKWSADFYRQGKRMDMPGQAAAIQYLVRIARQNGWKGQAPNIKLIAKRDNENQTSASEIFKQIAMFYQTQLAELLNYVPELSKTDKDMLRQKVAQLDAKSIEQATAKAKPKRMPARDTVDDYDDGTNQMRGSQTTAAMQAVNGAIEQVAKKYGKDAAHRIRQQVAKAGNPLLALQTELSNAGMTLSESVMQHLNSHAKRLLESDRVDRVEMYTTGDGYTVTGEIEYAGQLEFTSKDGKIFIPVSFEGDVSYGAVSSEISGPDPDGPADPVTDDISVTLTTVSFDIYANGTEAYEDDPIARKAYPADKIPTSIKKYLESKAAEQALDNDSFAEDLANRIISDSEDARSDAQISSYMDY